MGGESTEHVGPKILYLAPIGAEISQVRFDAKKLAKTWKPSVKNDTLFSCRDFVCLHNHGVEGRYYAQLRIWKGLVWIFELGVEGRLFKVAFATLGQERVNDLAVLQGNIVVLSYNKAT